MLRRVEVINQLINQLINQRSAFLVLRQDY